MTDKYVALKRLKNPADLKMYDIGQEVPVRDSDVRGMVATKRIKKASSGKIEKVVKPVEVVQEKQEETKEVSTEVSEEVSEKTEKKTYRTKQIVSE